MRNNQVQDLITQLNCLQLQQTELFARLGKVIGNKRVQTRGVSNKDAQTREVAHKVEVKQTREFAIAHKVAHTREFAIRDRVTVKHPNLFQADKGTITKIRNKK
jgi:hypothetical protein